MPPFFDVKGVRVPHARDLYGRPGLSKGLVGPRPKGCPAAFTPEF